MSIVNHAIPAAPSPLHMPRRRNRRQTRRSTRLAALAAISCLSFRALPGFADPIYTWQGSSANNNWTSIANWVGNNPPQINGGDEVEFPAGASFLTSNVDVIYPVDSIVFDSSANNSSAGAYTITSTNNANLLTIDTGIVQNSGSTETFSSPFSLGANQTWTFGNNAGSLNLSGGLNTKGFTLSLLTSSTGSGTISGIIDGSGSVNLTAGSTINLAGSNTYTGGTILKGGQLLINSDASFGNAPSAPATNITFAGGAFLEIAAGAGDIALNANRTISIASSQTAALNPNGSTLTIPGAIIGGGGVALQSAGTLILSGTNSFTGGISVNAGSNSTATFLVINSDSSLGGVPSSPSSNNLQLYSGATLATQAASNITLSGNRGILLGGGGDSVALGNSSALTVPGIVSGGALSVTGGAVNGVLNLAGSNTYTGGTTISGGHAAVAIASDASLGAVPSSPSANVMIDAGTLALIAGSGTVTLNANRDIVSGVSLGSATFDPQAAGDTLVVPGIISSNFGDSIVVQGLGTLELTNAANSYVGAIFDGGTLDFTSDGALGRTGTALTHVAITLNGMVAGMGVLQLDSTAGSLSLSPFRDISLGGNYSAIDPGGAAQILTVPGVVSGSGALNVNGPGTLTLTGSNSYTGGTFINGSTLNINAAAALGLPLPGNGHNVSVQFDSSGTLQLASNAGTVNLAGAYAIDLEDGVTATFDTNGAGNTLRLPPIGVLGLGTASVTATGGGTVILASGSVYDGSTTVKSGTLELPSGTSASLDGPLFVGNSSNPGASNSAVAVLEGIESAPAYSVTVYTDGFYNGSTFTATITNLMMTGGQFNVGRIIGVDGNITINASATGSAIDGSGVFSLNNATTTFNVSRGSGTYDLDVPAEIAGATSTTASVVKSGAGVMRIDGNNADVAFTLSGGTLALESDTALGYTDSTRTVLSPFAWNGGTVTPDGGNRTIANPVTISNDVTIGASLDGVAHAINFTANTTISGLVTLTDNNSDPTTFAAINVGSNMLTFAGTGNTTVNGAVSGRNGIVFITSGTVTLNGSNTYTGGTSVRGGTLIVSASDALPSTGTLTIQRGVAPGGFVQLEPDIGPSTIAALQIATGSQLDITDNALAISYGSPAKDPVTTIRGYLQTGYGNDTWTGTGIVSSYAAAHPGLNAVGYADGNTDMGTPAGANVLLIQYTLAGDSNLDGVVNFPDLLVVAQNFGKTGKDWAQGDFNYDGVVNFPDLLLIAQNFGKQLSTGELAQLPGSFTAEWQLAEAEIQAANVPEPRTPAIIALAAAVFLARRRRAPHLPQ